MHHGGGGGAGHGHGGHHGGGGAGHGHGGNHSGHNASHGAHHSGQNSHHSHHHHGGAPSQSASWNMAMQADPFWAKLLKENQRPLIAVVGTTFALVGWLGVIHFLNHRDNPNHVVSKADWDQQLTAINPHAQTDALAANVAMNAAQTEDGPLTLSAQPLSGFGAPVSVTGVPLVSQNPAQDPAQQTAQRMTPSLAPAMMSAFMPGGYTPQQQSFAPAPYSGGSHFAAQNSAMQNWQSQQIMPVRNHSAERYRMVVQR